MLPSSNANLAIRSRRSGPAPIGIAPALDDGCNFQSDCQRRYCRKDLSGRRFAANPGKLLCLLLMPFKESQDSRGASSRAAASGRRGAVCHPLLRSYSTEHSSIDPKKLAADVARVDAWQTPDRVRLTL